MQKKFSIKILFFLTLIFFSKYSISDDINKKIKEFILKNPEIIVESLNNFEKQKEDERRIQDNKKVEDLREEIFETDTQVYEGDSDASKVVVEFFDYNCSYCKRVHEDLKTVLKKSSDIKIIYKNFPILSENSVNLAKYAIIISEIDHKKFIQFHNFIISHKGRVNDNHLVKIFNELNIIKSEIDVRLEDKKVIDMLEKDISLAQKLGLRGTPAFIIKDEIIFGYINSEEILSKLN